MAQAVLGFWVATAFVGVYMFTFTTGAARSRATSEPGQPTTRLPPLTLFVHPLFGLAGVLTWIGYLAAKDQALAWITLGILVAGAGIGDVLLIRTLKDRRPGETLAEHRIPKAAMVTHGVLASTTILLVLLVALGVDSQSDQDDADFGRTTEPVTHTGGANR